MSAFSLPKCARDLLREALGLDSGRLRHIAWRCHLRVDIGSEEDRIARWLVDRCLMTSGRRAVSDAFFFVTTAGAIAAMDSTDRIDAGTLAAVEAEAKRARELLPSRSPVSPELGGA